MESTRHRCIQQARLDGVQRAQFDPRRFLPSRRKLLTEKQFSDSSALIPNLLHRPTGHVFVENPLCRSASDEGPTGRRRVGR